MVSARVVVGLISVVGAAAAEAQVATPVGPPLPVNLLKQGTFEAPDLGTGSAAYAYGPTGTPWTFAGGTGVAANGSLFTLSNPPAPQGDQVAFIQSGLSSVISQSFDAPAGRYLFTLRAAQRRLGTVLNQQRVSVRVDGVEVAQLSPAGDSYSSITTDTFVITGASHLIQLVCLNTSGDNTLFIDDLRLQRIDAVSASWSNPATWGGPLPGPNSEVVVPAGVALRLDTTASIKSLTVHGALYCADENISLQAEWVMVHGGRFECGSAVSPMLNTFTLTLAGADDGGNIMGMGDKFLAGMSGAVIELHGEERTSWTQLAATAPAGSSTLLLAEPADWRPGDQIIVAPTHSDPSEGEVALIAAIQNHGTEVTLSAPLRFRHYGETSEYSNPTTTWTLDERGEVGLLTRNIRIQGDAASETAGFGAHVMTMAGTTIHTSGIELFRVGQKGRLGRYPFHWHLVEHAPGQYIVNSSVHRSYNRCITVHGTHDTLVADNVCYDFIGHGYFLEDGIEQNNIFDHNLGVWARRPLPSEAILPTDYREANASNGPAVFWISHPDNIYSNNAAAGTEGSGYWYSMEEVVTGPSHELPGGTINPRMAPFGVFDNNRVHTGRQGFSSCTDEGGIRGMEPPEEPLLSGLTATNVLQGVWPCSPPMTKQNARFERMIVANSLNGMQAPNPMTFVDSLFVSYTDNAPALAQVGGGLDWRAVMIYDQGFDFQNVHFVNYDRPAMAVFQPTPGAHKLTNNRATRVSFDNSPHIFADPDNMSKPGNGPGAWGDVVHDVHGDLVRPGWALVTDHPLMFDSSCIQATNISVAGYVCPYRYSHFRTENFGWLDSTTILRSDGVHDSAVHVGFRTMHNFIATGRHLHSYRYDTGMKHERVWVELYNAFPGDTPVYEFLDVPSTVSVTTSGWTRASSLNALLSGPGRRWFWRDFSLFVKMSAAGENWHAYDRAELCMTGSCTEGQINALGSIPAAAIVSPPDGARVPFGSPIAIEAAASDPEGIISTRLYLGTALQGTDTTAPYNFVLNNVPAGSHALKLVAEDANHRTFTAVHQLIVGALPRVEISSPLEDQTYTVTASVPVAFNVFDWPVAPGSSHVHWFLDGVDRGHLDSTAPFTFTNLTQGRHELVIALADADHTIRAVNDRVIIYGVENRVLADYEDGVDTRGTATRRDRFMGSISAIAFGFGTKVGEASRADGLEDINYFTISNNNDGVDSVAIYRLKLDPPQDWRAYTHLQVSKSGPQYEAFVIDASEGANSIRESTGASTSHALSILSNAQRDEVVAIELRIPEWRIPPSTPTTEHLRSIRLLP